MASIDPSLISDPSEQKWVDEISKILNPQLHINIKTPIISIFQVPEIITNKKPEAYEPQQIGLGPNHHFRSQPYKKMEQKKLAAVRKVLDHHKIQDFELNVLDKVRKIVPMVRDCYDMFLQHDDDSLAWILAIDGLFLFGLFHSYNDGMLDEEQELELRMNKEADAKRIYKEEMKKFDIPSLSIESRSEGRYTEDVNFYRAMKVASKPQYPQIIITPKKRLLAQDILMAENQIPFMVLKEIAEALDPLSSGDKFSRRLYQSFSMVHSPLELCSASVAPEHLLDYMYHSIIRNPQYHVTGLRTNHADGPVQSSATPNNETNSVRTSIDHTLGFVTKCEKLNTGLPFPSASKLHRRAGYRFHKMPKIHGIAIVQKDIYLPCVTLNIDSEVTLRNLVAYETSLVDSDCFPLTEYVGFMCALIVDADDIKLLQKNDIIKGDLDVDEVAKLFIGLRNCIRTTKSKEKSYLQVMIEEVRKDYESRLTMEKKTLAHWLLVGLKAIGGFVEASWKIVAFIVSLTMVLMAMWQAYCNLYGDDKIKVATLPYASG